MTVKSNAYLRYKVLDRCFRDFNKQYFIDELVDACSNAQRIETGSARGISRRQVLYDIEFMSSENGWKAPIRKHKEGVRVYFRYENPDFSINNQPFNEEERNQVLAALDTISKFKGLPQFGWVSEISARVDSELVLSKNKQPVIDFGQNIDLIGLDFITPLYNSIKNKKVLSVVYKSFRENETKTYVLHPYFLKQYNNRWFLFGLNEELKKIQNIALDRIVKLEENEGKFQENNSIDFSHYFGDVVGVTVNKEKQIERVVLSVENTLLPYIETKPLHGTQKVIFRGDKNSEIAIDVIPNYELESLILSHGERMNVIKPLDLRESISNKILKMALLYHKTEFQKVEVKNL